MEIYTLDSLHRRIHVIDQFESFIWTERYNSIGDFKLTLHSTIENRSLLKTGTRLIINESYRVMEVETFENFVDPDGKNLLTVTGRSLEKILDDRVARQSLNDLTTEPKWLRFGFPATIAQGIVYDICFIGVLDPGDVIPGITEENIFPIDTIPAPTEEILYEIDPVTLYEAVARLCDVYDIGFRLVRNPVTSQLHFNVYTGSDRTTSQDDLPAVIFSPDLDNLHNTTELTSIAKAKNVAFVVSPVGQEYVYPVDVDPDVEGFERRVLLVKADDITDEVPEDATARMIQRGKEELAKNRSFYGFDGEVSPDSRYKYDRDFYLGDLVEMRNSDGVTNNMRVTEWIFISDQEGDRSYPTLSVTKLITPGSWLSWDFNQFWEDLGDTEWVDLP